MRPYACWLLVALALAACARKPPAPPPAMDRELSIEGWQRVSSRHVSVVSAAGERRTLELVAQLERLIGVMHATGYVRIPDARVPATILLFPSAEAFAYFRPPGVLGSTSETARGFFVLMGPDYESRSVLFHEYVHLMMRNGGGIEYPLWYQEGLAQFLETVSFREHLASLGSPPDMRLPAIRGGSLPDLDALLGARSYADLWRAQPQFYAESWLLTHLLYLGHHVGYVRRVESLQAYLQALQTAPDWRGAFDASFRDGGFEALAADLESYRERVAHDQFIPRLRIDTRQLPGVDTTARSEPVGSSEIAVELGSIYLDFGSVGARYAERLFERALETDPNSARARAGMARAQALLGRFEQAKGELARAGSRNSEDAFVLRAEGAVLLLEADALKVPDRASADASRAAAREALRRAVELEPDIPEASALLGASYLRTDEDVAEGLAALERAHALLPWNEGINLDLARLYAQADQPARALEQVDRVLRWSHGRSLEEARSLREEIELARSSRGARSRAGGS